MLNSLRLRMELDNANVMRGLSQFEQGVKRAGSTVQEHITDKLRGAFAVGAIEEMTRRTGEWSLELDRNAGKLGVTREHLQAMRILAEHASVSVEKITTYYNKLENSALKALNGNEKLKASFKALGMNARDVNEAFTSGDTTKQDNMLARAASAKGRSGGQTAIMEIFGPKSLTDMNSIGRQLGDARNIDDYAKEHESLIMPEQEVKENAKAWEQFLENTKAIAIKFSWVTTIILKILDGLSNMVNGVFKTIGALLDPKKWLTKAGRDELAVRVGSVGRSIANTIPELASGVVNLSSKALGYDKRVDWSWMDDPRKAYGSALTEEQYRQSEGMADALTTVASFGTAPIARTVGFGIKGAGATAGFLGGEATAGTLGKLATRVSKIGSEGLIGRLTSKIGSKLMKAKPEEVAKLIDELGITRDDIERLGPIKGGKELEALQALVQERLQKMNRYKIGRFINNNGSLLGLYASGDAAGQRNVTNAINMENAARAGESRPGGLNPALFNAGSLNASVGGSGNVSIGGVFGANIQGRLVSLTEKMVELLQRLVTNTNPQREEASNLTSYIVGNP